MKKAIAIAFIFLLSFVGCKKDEHTEVNPIQTVQNLKITVEDAKNWFESNVISMPNGRQSTKKYTLFADWRKAFNKKNNTFETVVVPVIYTDNGKLSENALNKLFDKFYNDRRMPNVATALLISKDNKGKIGYEVATYIPENSSSRFSGYTVVSDWNGEFIKGFKVKDGIVVSPIYSKEQKKKGRSGSCGGQWINVSWDEPFITTDENGNLTGIGVIHHSSSYFVESDCDSAPSIDYGGGGNEQYGDYGGGTIEAIPAGIIQKDGSIANHPKFNCIYEKLRYGNEQFNSLLGSLSNNLKWNLEFKLGENLSVGNAPVNGLTSGTAIPFTSGNITIELNKTTLNDAHAIWIAKTFLHEAYHAFLIQMIYEKVGTSQVSQWRVKPEQSELLELMKYIEEVGVQGAQHEYMANHLETMVTGMKQFVSKEYPQTYQQIYINGGGDAAFYALCLAGLEGTNFYQKYLLDKNMVGLQMAELRNNFLNANEKPNCYE